MSNEKVREYFNFYTELWKFMKKYLEIEKPTEEDYRRLVEESSELGKKDLATELLRTGLICATLDGIDEVWNE
ncbi:endonuclease YncB(thermonuclease family) [Lachnospiraceae bacterium PFB1-21]